METALAASSSHNLAGPGTNRLKHSSNYDSVRIVTREGHRIVSPRERMTQGIALCVLLVLFGLATLGPSGLLAWGENLRLLDQRRAQIAELRHQRDELRTKVAALDPKHADPDFVGELIRENLNVVHPDEVVITLEPVK